MHSLVANKAAAKYNLGRNLAFFLANYCLTFVPLLDIAFVFESDYDFEIVLPVFLLLVGTLIAVYFGILNLV